MFSTCFRVKNVKEFKHNHDIIYQGRSSENGCNDHYVGENSRWTLERVLNHAERDSNQHLFTNSVENGYPVLEKKIMQNYWRKIQKQGWKTKNL